MKISVERTDEIISNIARKYCRKTSISYEDFYQDLWVKALELDTDNIKILITSLVNCAIDISRKNWKVQNSEDGYVSTSNFSEGTEEFLFNNCRSMSHNTEDLDGYIQSVEVIMNLPTRERKFAIAKVYLNSGDERFATEYSKLLGDITEERLELLRSYDKSTYTDDIILKVFLGIKTGTNSASARTIKWNLIQALGLTK